MEVMQGKVDKVYVNGPKPGKNGKNPYYIQVVQMGDDRYSIFTDGAAPIANPGDDVVFMFEVNTQGDKTYRNIDKKSWNNKGGGQAASKPAQGASGGSGGGYTDRTGEIKRGRAVNAAVAFVQAGVAEGEGIQEMLSNALRLAVRAEVMADLAYDKWYAEEKEALVSRKKAPEPEPEPDDDIPF